MEILQLGNANALGADQGIYCALACSWLPCLKMVSLPSLSALRDALTLQRMQLLSCGLKLFFFPPPYRQKYILQI